MRENSQGIKHAHNKSSTVFASPRVQNGGIYWAMQIYYYYEIKKRYDISLMELICQSICSIIINWHPFFQLNEIGQPILSIKLKL